MNSMQDTKLSDEFFKLNNFRLVDGEYWAISFYDSDYLFKYVSHRDDWGFYMEYTDSPFKWDQDKKYPVSFGLHTEGHVKQLMDIISLSAYSPDDVINIQFTQ